MRRSILDQQYAHARHPQKIHSYPVYRKSFPPDAIPIELGTLDARRYANAFRATSCNDRDKEHVSMNGGNEGPLIERRRLGGWMPGKEQMAAAFRQDLAAKARERASRMPLSSVVLDLAQLVHGDPVLR
jgi:hypothetical protein